MIKRLFLILLFISLQQIYCQEEISIHKLHKDLYGLQCSQIQTDTIVKNITLIDKNKKSTLTHVVFGYLPDWEYSNFQYLRYDLLTHIACFDFYASSIGSLTNPANWPWTNVINSAHSNGVKVIMTVTNFDKDAIRSIIRNNAYKLNLINNIKTKISAYNLDGVNIDFEGMYSDDEGYVINNFMQELSDSIHKAFPNSEVSFAGPAVNWGQDWDLLGLANSCDYIFIMGYAFNGSWSKKTAPNSPLNGTTYCITNTIETQYGSVTNTNPEKLILGIPYYGYHWKTETQEENSNVIQSISSTRFVNDENNIQTYGLQWSTKYSNSWYRWNDGAWHQVWYDNDSSLGLKYDFAINKNLRGVGMWALCYDGNRQELWNLIEKKFKSTNNIFAKEKEGPDNFSILPNYPNPFNPITQICFLINEPGKIIIQIFSPIGALIKYYEEEYYSAGQYKITWDGKNQYDELMSSGCYIYRITFINRKGIINQKSSKMLLLK